MRDLASAGVWLGWEGDIWATAGSGVGWLGLVVER